MPADAFVRRMLRTLGQRAAGSVTGQRGVGISASGVRDDGFDLVRAAIVQQGNPRAFVPVVIRKQTRAAVVVAAP